MSRQTYYQGWKQCQCGCGEWFYATWVTRQPIYKNKTHRQRAYRARARRRARAWDEAMKAQFRMELFEE